MQASEIEPRNLLRRASGKGGSQPHQHRHAPHLPKPMASVIEHTVDKLCSEQYAENSYEGLAELSDLVGNTPQGTMQVSRAIRKQLKCGQVHQQKRALTVLEGLVEMGSKQFQHEFANDKLAERIKYLSNSPTCDAGVRRKLMLILLSWRRHFMHDPSMAFVTSLYGQCGGIDHTAMLSTARAHREIETRQAENEPSGIREATRSGITSVDGTIHAAESNSQLLLEAMVDAKSRPSPILEDQLVQALVDNVLVVQKELVRYIHTVNDEEYLDKLVRANDQIVDVLQRLQSASFGGPLPTHPLGTEPAEKQNIIEQAVRRLSRVAELDELDQAPTNPNPGLSSQIDASLVANSGFTSKAPSRAPVEDYDTDSDAEDLDMNIVAQNTKAVEGSTSARAMDAETSASSNDKLNVPKVVVGDETSPATTHAGAAPPIFGALTYQP